jgi:anti-sigma B factor antagonist
MLLLIRFETHGDHLVVATRGELDFASVDVLLGAVKDAVGASPADVVLDLDDVTFMDCTALRGVVETSKHLTASGGSLSVVCTNRFVRRVMRLTGFEQEVTVFDHLSGAVGTTCLPPRHRRRTGFG